MDLLIALVFQIQRLTHDIYFLYVGLLCCRHFEPHREYDCLAVGNAERQGQRGFADPLSPPTASIAFQQHLEYNTSFKMTACDLSDQLSQASLLDTLEVGSPFSRYQTFGLDSLKELCRQEGPSNFKSPLLMTGIASWCHYL
jgi:hypothetical protein